MKDESNQRITEKMKELYEFMAKEDRGFIFVPMMQYEGNHMAMCFVSFNKNPKELDEADMIRFWATIAGLIENIKVSLIKAKLPEKTQQDYEDGFIPFVRTVAEKCFPSIGLFDATEEYHITRKENNNGTNR